MKKLIAAALFICVFSCNTSTNDTSTATDSTTTDIGGVRNVNGNIPDTNALGATPNSGDNTTRVDSTYADTATKKGR